MAKKKEYSASSGKLLGALLALEKEGLCCCKEGAYFFLTGKSDFNALSHLPFFGSLLSLGKKRHAANINHLLEKGYLQEVIVEEGEAPYLRLTHLGEEDALLILAKEERSRRLAKAKKPLPRFVPIEMISSHE